MAQNEQKRQQFQALLEIARLISTTPNKRQAKHLWCQAAKIFLGRVA